jgi:hypothetical protein
MRAKASRAAVLFLIYLALPNLTRAQEPLASVKPYDGIQAGLDAYHLGEEKRQGAVNQQIVLNDQMRYWNGYPTSRGETLYYGYMSPAALAAYGYSGYGPWSGFQLGPWMGSGLWGTPYYFQPARQPIGQQQIQVSPNRWESHPIYDPPLTMYRPQPPVDSPLLDRTPYATSTPTPTAVPPGPAVKLIDTIPLPPVPPASSSAISRGPREY